MNKHPVLPTLLTKRIVLCTVLWVIGMALPVSPMFWRSIAAADPVPDIQEARLLTVAQDPKGMVWAAWEGDSSFGRDVDLYFSRWDGQAWSVPQVVHSRPEAWDRSPSLAIAADGTPWLAWSAAERANPDRNSLYVSHWVRENWTSPEMVPVGDIPEATEPALAAASDGTLWLAWVGSDVAAGQDDEIFASHWDGTTWSVPQRVSADDRDPSGMASGLRSQYDRQPRLAVGQDGRPWLVWTGHQAGVDDEIFASHWTGTEWTPEQMISRDDKTLDVCPTLALDARGLPWVAWKGRVTTDGQESRLRILLSRWDVSRAAWTPEVVASSPLVAEVDEAYPSLALDGNGRMNLAWLANAAASSALAYARWDGQQAELLPPPRAIYSGVDTYDVALIVEGENVPKVLWLEPLPGSELPVRWAVVRDLAVPLEVWIEQQTEAAQLLGVPPIEDKYLAFGDSITWGQYPVDHPVQDPFYPYPSILQDTLRIRVTSAAIVVNAGEAGEGTYGGKTRIKEEVKKKRPHYVLIMEGTNDVSREVPLSEAYDNFLWMIDEARKNAGVDDVEVMLATIIPRLDDKNDETEEYNQQVIIPAQQAKKHVRLCDQWQAFYDYGPWQTIYWDDKHPNQTGLQLIADTFYGCILAGFYIAEESVPPITWIDPLPAESECGIVNVSWDGQDNLSWVVDYDVQVQVNGGLWTDWLVATQSTSGTYTSDHFGDVIAFRVRGRDVVGNLGVWSAPEDTQIVDSVPPYEAHVDPLPPVGLAPFAVSWWGRDACADVVAYRVQYSVGGTSNWVDWLYPTSNTSGSFNPSSPAYGQTYYFRVQAQDAAGNWSAPSNPLEAYTVLARFSLEGGVYNLRHQPVAAAQVGITPAPLWLGSQPGGFLAYTATSGNYDITASRDDLYGTLPAMIDLPVNQNVSGLQFILPPHDDAVADGGFEAGNLAGAWQVGGTTLPVLTGSAHTGQDAVRLDGAAGDSRLSQTVTPASGLTEATGGETPPLLSFLVRLDVAGPASVLRIELGSPPVIYDLPVVDTRWTHVWYDLAGPVGEPLPLTFVVSGNPAVILDEVSLGSALVGGRWVYLPLLYREW